MLETSQSAVEVEFPPTWTPVWRRETAQATCVSWFRLPAFVEVPGSVVTPHGVTPHDSRVNSTRKKRLARPGAKRFLWRCRDPSSPPRGNSSRFPSQLHTKKAPCPNRGKAFFVEVPGIEPGSFGTGAELLRAQPAALFLAPTITQASRRQAQSLFDVPHHCVTQQ